MQAVTQRLTGCNFLGSIHKVCTLANLDTLLQVTRQLRMDGWPALSIHGDKSQQERDWVLSEFKQNKSPIMLATDVAARGLGRTKLASCCLFYAVSRGSLVYVCNCLMSMVLTALLMLLIMHPIGVHTVMLSLWLLKVCRGLWRI